MDIEIIFSNLEKADKVRYNFIVFGNYSVYFDKSSCEISEDNVLLQRIDINKKKYLELKDKCNKEIERRKLMRLEEFENQLKKIKG